MAENMHTDEAHKRPRRLWIWLAVAGVLVVAIVAGLLVTEQPSFCGTCHEMQPAYQGWLDGDHAEVADCMDCHADPGIVGYFKAHVVDGLRDVYIHFIAGPPEQVEDSFVPPLRCLECHDDDFEDPDFSEDHPEEDSDCSECHRDEIHENDRPGD